MRKPGIHVFVVTGDTLATGDIPTFYYHLDSNQGIFEILISKVQFVLEVFCVCI